MKKIYVQLLTLLLLSFAFNLLNKSFGQISYPASGSFMSLPPLSPGNNFYDVCYSSLIADFNFDIGSTVPSSVTIVIPKGACLMDVNFNLIGILLSPTTYYDNYEITGLTAYSTFSFKVELSTIDCQFFSLGTPEPVRVKVIDGITELISVPVLINRPSFAFIPVTPDLTDLLKGSTDERKYRLQAFQIADYNNFTLAIDVESELYIHQLEVSFLDQNNNQVGQTLTFLSTPISCSQIPLNIGTYPNASYVQTAQNLEFKFSKIAGNTPDFLLPSGFENGWKVEITEYFYAITVSGNNDPQTEYTIKTDCNTNPANSVCAPRDPCNSFESLGNMDANVPDPGSSACTGVLSGLNNAHLILDAYSSNNSDLYYRINVGGSGPVDARRFYGIRFTINNDYFSIPESSGIISINDLEVKTYDGSNEFTFVTSPVISSLTIGNLQHISICFRSIANGAYSGGDPDGAGPLTNIFNDPTRLATEQYFGDLLPGNQFIIDFKNVVFNTSSLIDLQTCGDHFITFIQNARLDLATVRTVDLCITDDGSSNRQIHRNTTQNFSTCDPDLANWPGLSAEIGGISGNLVSLFSQHFDGFTTVVADNTDIVETIGAPGQQDEVELSYTFNMTNANPILSPWNIGGPPPGCPSGPLNHNLLSQYGELYYAYVEIPDGFYISNVSGDVDPGYVLPTANSGCTVYNIVLTQPDATINIKVKMSGCPGISTCTTSTNNQQTVGSGNSEFYLEFRSQLNTSTSGGQVDPVAYYITYGCGTLTLYYHCNNLCTNPNIGVNSSNFSMKRNSFGWSNLNDYIANPNNPTLTSSSTGVSLDRVYLGDDILVTSTNGSLSVNTSSSCIASNLNFEISYESPNGVPDVFIFTGGEVQFTETNNTSNVFTVILDGGNQGTVWTATTSEPPGGGEPGWSYLTVQMNLANMPGNISNSFTLKELINGLDGVTQSAVQIDFEGHYTVDCGNTSTLDPGFYYMGQIRSQFTADDGVATYGSPNTGMCFSSSCDPWGSFMTMLIVETRIARGLRGSPGTHWLFNFNSNFQRPCEMTIVCEITTIGGLPGYTDDFPNEYRPLVRYPDNYNFTLSNNLYLSRAYMYFRQFGMLWYGPFDPAHVPPWRIYYNLLNCNNSEKCPTLDNGSGDPNHQGDPLHPGGLVNFEYNSTTNKIITNNYNHAATFPASHTWMHYRSQQKGETRNFGFNLTKECFIDPGEQFDITDFDLPLSIYNSRTKSGLENLSNVPIICNSVTANNSLTNIAFSYTNPAPPTTPMQFNPVGLAPGSTNYNTSGNLVTFCVDMNIYEGQTGWIYVDPTDPNDPSRSVYIVDIKYGNPNCTPKTTTGILQNSHNLWYFDCSPPGKLYITVSFDCNLNGSSTCGQCYGPTTIRFNYGFHCNHCILSGLNPLDPSDLLELQKCNQHASFDVDFTPQIPQLSFTALSNVNEVFCNEAEINLSLFTFAGSNPNWGEIRNPLLRIYGPEGASASLTSSGTTYTGSYIGVSPGGYYEYDLINTITDNALDLIFSYFPGCGNFPSTTSFSYSLFGDDGCDNPVSFNSVATTNLNFASPVPIPDPLVSWSGPQQLNCIAVGQYTVTVSNILDDGDLIYSVCLPSFVDITTSNPVYNSFDPISNCYEWIIPVVGGNNQNIIFDISSNTSAICNDFNFVSYAQLIIPCNSCVNQSLNIQENYLVNICCSTPCTGINIDLNSTVVNNSQSGGSIGSITLAPTGGTAPYSYNWSNGGNTNVIINLSAGQYTVTVTDANGCTATETFLISEPCDGFTTQTQGGWGIDKLVGNNPGKYMHNNFGTAFPTGITIGCNHTLHFSLAANVTSFLPCGSTPAVLTSSYVNPSCGAVNNVFASQVLTLTISVGFDLAIPSFGSSNLHLEDLFYIDNSSPFHGWTVQQILTEANLVLGGCTTVSPAYLIDLHDAVTNINENYVDGNTNNGFLSCTFELGGLKTMATSQKGTNSSQSIVAAVTRGGTLPYSYQWNTGDSTQYVYDVPTGTYYVTVTDANNNTDTSSIFVTGFTDSIYTVIPGFDHNFDVNSGTVSITDTSYSQCNITGYMYGFYPLGDTSSLMNPIFNYDTAGVYTVCQTIISTCIDGQIYMRGTCEDIELPAKCKVTADFSRSINGCTATFTNLSTYYGPNVSYTWLFGDSTSYSGHTPPPHAYALNGVYNVCLIATVSGTLDGIQYSCSDTICKTISIRDCATQEPGCDVKAHFKTSINNCAVYITDLTTYTGNIVSWTWDFGDGTIVIGQYPPPHLYTQSGSYTICLDIVVYNPETEEYCYDRYCEDIYIDCETDPCQIYPYFTYEIQNCLVSFTNWTLTNGFVISWHWDFGDPVSASNISNSPNPYHQFSTPGYYYVCLTIQTLYNDKICTEKYCMEVEIRDECDPCEFECGMEFYIKGCKLFTTASVDPNYTTVFWEYGDGTSGMGINSVHTYTQPGSYIICMNVLYDNGVEPPCICTKCYEINIEECNSERCELEVNFDYIISENCLVSFNDYTVSGANTSILSWHWDFGDGYFSYNQSPTHTYYQPGQYKVCLKIIAWTGEEYCHYEYCVEIKVDDCIFTREIPGLSYSSLSDIKIMPNPNDGNFIIEFKTDMLGVTDVQLMNVLGQIVVKMSHNSTEGVNNIRFEAGNLPKGIYFLKLSDGKQNKIARVVLH